MQLDPEVMGLVIETAQALKITPRELLKQMSYETGGTLDPRKAGPTTKWGQHRGLIQFGESQAEEHGADFSTEENAWKSQLGKDGAIVSYLTDRGFKPGQHSGLDMYSTINAGGPGRYGASDAAAGGAPGTVQEKYEEQMGGHQANANRWLGQDTGVGAGASRLSYGQPAIRTPSYHDYGDSPEAGLQDGEAAGLGEDEEPLTGFAKWKAGIDGKISGRP